MDEVYTGTEDGSTAGGHARDGRPTDTEAGEDRPLSRRIVLELTAHEDHFAALEQLLGEIGL